MTFRKYLVLAGITAFGAAGDSMLSHGMKQSGGISLHNLQNVILALGNPWTAAGTVLLLGFFAAYMTALSWADLTYVLPASAFGYVVTAFLSRFFLHEAVSPWRWAGVMLITCGVGLVARGPSLTERRKERALAPPKGQHDLA